MTKNKETYAPRLAVLQVGAIAPQYAPDVCEPVDSPGMPAEQQYAASWSPGLRGAGGECLSIQTCSGEYSQCS
jgi:hypothetical protein